MKINKKNLDILQCRAGLTGAQLAAKAGLKPQSYSTAERVQRLLWQLLLPP